MSELNFEGNAKQLFDTFIKAPPFPLRPMVRKALTKALLARVGPDGAADPQSVVAAVRDSTPGPFLKGALKSVAGLHRCETRCAGCGGDCPLAP